MYDSDVSSKLAYHLGSTTRGNKYKVLNHRFHYEYMIHTRRKRCFLHALLTSGIVYQNMLSVLTPSTCSRHV